MNRDDCVTILVRAAQRGATPESITAYASTLDIRSKECLLALLPSPPEGYQPSGFLRLIWPARELHPQILPAVTAAATEMQAAQADAFLTEAEALLSADANTSKSSLERLRCLTRGATALLSVKGLNMHSPRLVAACARCAMRLPIQRALAAADRIVFALIDRVAVPPSDFAGAAILAALHLASTSGISNDAIHLLRSRITAFVQFADGVYGHDTPAIFKAVLSRVATADEADTSNWGRVALQIARRAPVRYFSDLLSLFEWHAADSPVTADRILRLYDCASSAKATSTAQGSRSSYSSGGEVTCRDIGLFFAILRSADAEIYRRRILLVMQSVIRHPLQTIDCSSVSGSSSVLGDPENSALRSTLLGSLALPGVDLRCGAVVEYCQWFLLCEDDCLRQWAVAIMTELFVRQESARGLILDTLLGGLTEALDRRGVGESYCEVLERVTSHSMAHVVFRDHLDSLKTWISYVPSMPGVFAQRVVAAFAALASSNSAFCDFLAVSLRKLSCSRSFYSQILAAAGFIALLKSNGLDMEVAGSIVTMLADLLQAASLQLRAAILTRLSSLMLQHGCLLDMLSTFPEIHQVVFSRIERLQRGEGENTRHDCFPLRLNFCFDLVCKEPALRDAVPELIRYVLVLRRSSDLARDLTIQLVNYVSDPDRALRDTACAYSSPAVSAKLVFIKSRLLAHICELVLEFDEGSDTRSIFHVYSTALHIRDALANKVRPNFRACTSLSDSLNGMLSNSNDASVAASITAREGCARGLASFSDNNVSSQGNIGMESLCHVGDAPNTMTGQMCLSESAVFTCFDKINELLMNDLKRSVTLACEFMTNLVIHFASADGGKLGTRELAFLERLVLLAVDWLSKTHPWVLSEEEMQSDKKTTCLESQARADHVRLRTESRTSFASRSDVKRGTGNAPCSNEMPNERHSQNDVSRAATSTKTAEAESDLDVDAKQTQQRPIPARDRAQSSASIANKSPWLISDDFEVSRRGIQSSIAKLRYYSLQVVCNVFETPRCVEVCRAVQDHISKGMLRESESCAAGFADKDNTDEQPSSDPLRDLGLPLALLSCMEREFEYSMTTSVAGNYLRCLQAIVESESVTHSHFDELCCFRNQLCRVIARILADYSVTHPTVLRPSLALLLQSVEWKAAARLLHCIFSAYFENIGSKIDSSEEEEEEVDTGHNKERRSRLSLNIFDDDIVAEGMAIDGALESDIHGGMTAYDMQNVDEQSAPGEGIGDCAEQVSIPWQLQLPYSDSNAAEAEQSIFGFSLSNKQTVLRLSCFESEETTALSVCVGLSCICEQILKAKPHTGPMEASSESCIQNLTDVVTASWPLIRILLFGNHEKLCSDACLSRMVPLPVTAISRIKDFGMHVIAVGRDSVRLLDGVCQAREDFENEKIQVALTAIEQLLPIIYDLRDQRVLSRTGNLFEGRFRYMYEQFELELSEALSKLSRIGNLRACAKVLRDRIKQRHRLDSARDRTIATDIDVNEAVETSFFRRRNRRRLRSRNNVIDEWLEEEGGHDNYADMEDFIVEMNQRDL